MEINFLMNNIGNWSCLVYKGGVERWWEFVFMKSVRNDVVIICYLGL